jgi:hypothetical protein
MAVGTPNIVSVTTTDAAPTTAPHKISQKATKNRATVVFTPHASLTVYSYVICVGGSDAGTGEMVGRKGAIPAATLKPSADVIPSSWSQAATTQISEYVDYAELSDADGTYQTNIYSWVV